MKLHWKLRVIPLQNMIMNVLRVHVNEDGMVGGMVQQNLLEILYHKLVHKLGMADGMAITKDGRIRMVEGGYVTKDDNGTKTVGAINGLKNRKTPRGGEEVDGNGVVMAGDVQQNGMNGDGVMNADMKDGKEYVINRVIIRPVVGEVRRILLIGMSLETLRRRALQILCLPRGLLRAPPHYPTTVDTVSIHKGSGGMGCGTAEAALSRKNVITVVGKDQYGNKGGKDVWTLGMMGRSAFHRGVPARDSEEARAARAQFAAVLNLVHNPPRSVGRQAQRPKWTVTQWEDWARWVVGDAMVVDWSQNGVPAVEDAYFVADDDDVGFMQVHMGVEFEEMNMMQLSEAEEHVLHEL
ncbi:unnamed protein product [Symbiodinium sp. CCMP2456]|nr:unnamed protein product [Symbiodinium sp. CCMP2456]